MLCLLVTFNCFDTLWLPVPGLAKVGDRPPVSLKTAGIHTPQTGGQYKGYKKQHFVFYNSMFWIRPSDTAKYFQINQNFSKNICIRLQSIPIFHFKIKAVVMCIQLPCSMTILSFSMNTTIYVTSFSSISYCRNSDYKTSISFNIDDLNKTINSLPTSLILGEQVWDRASFQIGVSDLIPLITEGRLRHASGPAQHNSESVTFIVNVSLQ